MTRPLSLALLCSTLLLLASAAAGAQQRLPGRILGVFDEANGQPVSGAEVVDLSTGTKAVTTETGTISLNWLPAGTTILQIRRVGYASRMQSVRVSPTDTASITVVLTPLPQSLPTVVTRGRASDDTVRRLELAGFYDRRQASGAPLSAFVTAEQMEKRKPRFLTDIKYINGRGVCGDIYVNGTLDRGGLGSLFGMINQHPEEVAGVETYFGSEVPAAYNRTRQPGRRRSDEPKRCAVTLIWLK
jgi:hypothetical protein